MRKTVIANEKLWYCIRLWLRNGEKIDESLQATNDEEAIRLFKNPKRKPPKGSSGELRKMLHGREGETEHLCDHDF